MSILINLPRGTQIHFDSQSNNIKRQSPIALEYFYKADGEEDVLFRWTDCLTAIIIHDSASVA